MMSFLNFLVEKKMIGSGEEGERQYIKHVQPFLPGGQRETETNTHILGTKHEDLPVGTPLTMVGHGVEGENHFVTARAEGREGKTYKIPQSKIHRPKISYNEEPAVTHLWNHMAEGGHLGKSLEEMHRYVSSALADRSHPLHFDNIKSGEGFYGGFKTESSRKSYNRQIMNAIPTVHTVANHSDNRGTDLTNTKMEVVGKKGVEVKGKTYATKGKKVAGKTDLKLMQGNKTKMKITLKKEGGSQFASAYPPEMRGMLGNTIEHLRTTGKITDARAQELHYHADRLQRMMEDRRSTREASTLLHSIIQSHPDFHAHFANEAITGRSKFGEGSEAVPTHLLTHGRGAKLTRIGDIDYSKIRIPNVTQGKQKGQKNNPHIMRLLSQSFERTENFLGEEVWDTPSPSKNSKGLTARQKAMAKARAASRNRPYPNLVDNIWASKQ